MWEARDSDSSEQSDLNFKKSWEALMDDFLNIGEDFDLFEGGFDTLESGMNSGLDVFACEPKDEFTDDDLDEPREPRLELYLKAAKSRDCAYQCLPFPASLLCSPYKYHLKIVGPLDTSDLSLRLIFADSKKLPKCDKRPVVLDDLNILSPSERVIKFSLHICSFHFRRKEFQLIISSNGRDVFTSNPFRTYARRRTPPKRMSPPPQPRKSSVAPPPRGPPTPVMNPYQAYPNQFCQQGQQRRGPMMMPMQQRQQQRRGPMQYPMMSQMRSPRTPQTPQQQRFPNNNNNFNNRNHQYTPKSAPRPQMVAPFPYGAMNYPVNVNNIQQLRASLAIQLLNSLNPMERQAVMNCAGFSN